MNVFKRLYTVAKANERQYQLIESLVKDFEKADIDLDGLQFELAIFIDDCYIENDKLYSKNQGRLDNGGGLIDGAYFCEQHNPWEDYYSGRCYFATKKPNLWIAVPFDI